MPSSIVSLSDPPSLTPHPLYAHITSITLTPSCTVHNISGQVAIHDPLHGTPSIPPSLSEQIDVCLARMDVCLDHLGAKISDIAVFNYFIVERFYQYEGNEALEIVGAKAGVWLQGHRPASTLLVVNGLSQREFAREFQATVYLGK